MDIRHFHAMATATKPGWPRQEGILTYKTKQQRQHDLGTREISGWTVDAVAVPYKEIDKGRPYLRDEFFGRLSRAYATRWLYCIQDGRGTDYFVITPSEAGDLLGEGGFESQEDCWVKEDIRGRRMLKPFHIDWGGDWA